MTKIDRVRIKRNGDLKDPADLVAAGKSVEVEPVEETGAVELIDGNSLKLEPIDWLWDGWLAKGKLHILAGPPGTGKTTVAVALAATITNGGRWPDGSRASKADVLIWSGEDDYRDTLLPRLIACGGNPGRVQFVSSTYSDEGKRPFDPALDTPGLAKKIHDNPPGLLIVDPIVSAVTGDSHKNSETRRALQPLVDLAKRLGVATLGISHFAKSSAGRLPVERVAGSLAFGAVARVVLAAVKMPEDDEHPRVLCRAKSNIGPDGGGFGFDLKQVDIPDHPGIRGSRLLWTGKVDGEAHEILGIADDLEDESRSDAEAFLLEELRDGAVATKDLQKAAKGAGIGWRTVERAKKRLGIVAKKRSFGGGWEWSMPHDEGDSATKTATPKTRRSSRSSTENDDETREDREDRQDTDVAVFGGVGDDGGDEEWF